VDTGFGQGDEISPFYDSMIAKLIVWGEDRQQALGRLDAALSEVHLVGLHNNAQFLRRTVQSVSFRQPDLDTALIEREKDWLMSAPELDETWAIAGIAAQMVYSLNTQELTDVFAKPSGWRLVGPARWHIELMAGSQPRAVSILRHRDGNYALQWGDAQFSWSYRPRTATCFDVTLGTEQQVVHVYAWASRYTVIASSGSKTISVRSPWESVSDAGPEKGGLAAPMPGKVISIMVEAGQKVRAGQALAVMEAMKMEHIIHAPANGVVSELLYAVGDQVLEGAAIFRMES
jgi:3-methylcrotonyl-CoA carboxylase alpha subunit